jgi:hypothetical protein
MNQFLKSQHLLCWRSNLGIVVGMLLGSPDSSHHLVLTKYSSEKSRAHLRPIPGRRPTIGFENRDLGDSDINSTVYELLIVLEEEQCGGLSSFGLQASRELS